MRTKVLRLVGRRGSAYSKQLSSAAGIIKRGGVVVFPTDTVYGIGASALNTRACLKVYEIKGRERGKALIVLASDMKMIDKVAVIPKRYRKALEATWPAPLTVIVKARASLPKIVTAERGTVAVRIPDNKTVISLIKAAGVPIVAPSANPSGLSPSKTGTQARKYFDGKVSAIIDAGGSGKGVPSTVIELQDMRVLRKGAFTIKQIKDAFKNEA